MNAIRKFLLLAGVASLAAAGVCGAAPKPAAVATSAVSAVHKGPTIPAREWAMIRQIAVNYDLNNEQTWLLAAIRRHENGRAGLEFGIGGPMNNGHPSHRYQDGYKSFYIQGSWAAGTIKRNYNGNLFEFAGRYCPAGKVKWASSVIKVMSRLRAENHYVLPGEKPPKRDISFP